MNEFDVVVIGCGPAGFAAAMRSYDFGKHVCIIEGGEIGGAGVMHGALTSKTMWELSKDFSGACAVDRGFRASGLNVDYQAMKESVLAAAKNRQLQMLSQLETFAKGKTPDRSITLIRGHAEFKDEKTVVVSYPDERKDEEIVGQHFILATGSKPRPHPTLEADGKQIINSDHILDLQEFPKRMIVIGAGIIGCEFATIFSRFKKTEVHILDRENRVIPFEDDDVSDFVEKNLTNLGVIVHHEATLREVRKFNDRVEVILDYKGGHSRVIEVDVVLVSIGRVPNTDLTGLENVGIDFESGRRLSIDNQCQITENIYAAGDIASDATGKSTALVNVAELEGRFAAKSINETVKFSLRYENMPVIMFFSPEVATVGKNEKQCQKEGIAYRAVNYSLNLVSRAISMRNTNGFVKILVTDDEKPKILGMRAAGPQSSASIMSIALLMDQDKTLEDIMKTIHPHPSITEGIQEALRTLVGKGIYKPEAFPDSIKTWSWAPLN